MNIFVTLQPLNRGQFLLVKVCPRSGSLYRADVQGQHNELGELSGVEVIVADDDQRLPPIWQ